MATGLPRQDHELLRTTSFVSTKMNSMEYFENWTQVPLNTHVRLNTTQPCLKKQGGKPHSPILGQGSHKFVISCNPTEDGHAQGPNEKDTSPQL